MSDVSALSLEQLQQENARLLALIGQKEQTIQQQKSSIETLQHCNTSFIYSVLPALAVRVKKVWLLSN